MYKVVMSSIAQDDVAELAKHCPKAIGKLGRLLDELTEHPRTGTGKVEQLKHFANETWSRRITKEHRLVYEIHDNQVLVLVISAYGHYE